jgi:His/Glu/Gln/Arg/opine family amino acid ABC transporter permease subunit
MDFALIWTSLPRLLAGGLLTIKITAITIVTGLVVAAPVALMRASRSPFLWAPAYGYIFFIRGTPLLAQMVLIYYGSGEFRDFFESIGLWVFLKEPFFAAIVTLTINTSAYTAELFRGAIQGVPKGDIEAARALGMSRLLQYRRIILPQAFRLALPAYGNEVILLFQSTSLISIITLLDLTGVARIIAAQTFAVYDIYFTAGAIYLIITYGILWIFNKVESRLMRHLKDRPGATKDTKKLELFAVR